jgi:hypothetical protein
LKEAKWKADLPEADDHHYNPSTTHEAFPLYHFSCSSLTLDMSIIFVATLVVLPINMLNNADDVHTNTPEDAAKVSEEAGTHATDSAEEVHLDTAEDTHSELVQNFLDAYQGANQSCIRASIQEREEEIGQYIAKQNALWGTSKLETLGDGLRLLLEEHKQLETRIEGNRAVAAAMRGLLIYAKVGQVSKKALSLRRHRPPLTEKKPEELMLQA